MLADLVFALGVASLMAHELDAVREHEWRLLFVLRQMPDTLAHRWFVSLHVPIFVAVLLLVGAPDSRIVTALELAVDVFLVVHLGLHLRLRDRSPFGSRFSRSLIWAAAALGVLHAALLLAG